MTDSWVIFWNNLPQILIACATLVTAAGGFFLSWRNNQVIKQVQVQTNGMNARIVQAERKDARDQERAIPTPPDVMRTGTDMPLVTSAQPGD